MKKVTTTAGAAATAAPAPEAPRQTPGTAGEAGLTQTQPDPETDSEPDSEDSENDPEPEDSEPEQAPAFDPEAYREFLATVPSEDFEQAFEVMLGEAQRRGIVGTESDEDPVAESATQEVAETSEEESTRELMKRYGLKQAWKDEAGHLYFDEKAAVAANAHSFITAE